MSHDSAQFSPSFSLAKEAEIEYNPHVFWRGLRGFFSLPPRSGFVQPWNANNPPLRSGLSTFLFLLEVLRRGSHDSPMILPGRSSASKVGLAYATEASKAERAHGIGGWAAIRSWVNAASANRWPNEQGECWVAPVWRNCCATPNTICATMAHLTRGLCVE